MHLVNMLSWQQKTGNNVFLPATVTFAGFLALLTVFSLVRYSQGASQVRRSAAAKLNGRNVRRSTRSVNRRADSKCKSPAVLRYGPTTGYGIYRERKEVSRWSPEKTAGDSPSGKVSTELTGQ